MSEGSHMVAGSLMEEKGLYRKNNEAQSTGKRILRCWQHQKASDKKQEEGQFNVYASEGWADSGKPYGSTQIILGHGNSGKGLNKGINILPPS